VTGILSTLLARAAARTVAALRSNRQFEQLYTTIVGDIDNRETFSSIGMHEMMLADEVRLDAYHRAIAAHVKPGQTVLDVGTGSGVLAFFAAQRGARTVYAIDHAEIIDVAKRVAEHNRITNVEFLELNSKGFAPAERLDHIVQEQIGWCLFEENMVATLVDLRDRVLKPGGRILPNRFDLFIEPVQLKDKYRIPFIWEQRVQNIDYGCMQDLSRVEVPRGYHLRSLWADEVSHLLCEPELLYSCDLETMKETDLPDRFGSRRIVEHEGRLDGYCLYFRAIFDDTISFSTFPFDERTHWGVPLFRVEAQSCRKGDALDYELAIPNVRDPNTWRLAMAGSPVSRA